MELKRVHIRNFRSIENCKLTFEHRCRILVGINEAGKTNILKALSLLSKDTKVDSKDKREFKDDEPIEQDAYVDFYFQLNQTEKEIVIKKASSKILAAFIDFPFATVDGQVIDLSVLISNYMEVVYKVNINSKKKTFSVILSQDNIEAVNAIQKPLNALTDDVFNTYHYSPVILHELIAINTSDYPDIPKNYFTPLDKTDILKIIDFGISDVINDELPDCLMWDYDEKNLLPSQVSLSQFIQNPDICIPLKNMFFLAGIQDISKTISEYQQKTFGLRNLLERVSRLSSDHLHKVWQEYKDLQITLTINGDSIETAIRDQYKLYDLSRRSDGFKRFVSFILLISTRAKSQDLTNTLLLYDEPEISLHPSGCRHLRDELIRISDNNYVIFSTHSIFMIDQNITNRHYIVIKDSETTSIKEVNESNITDEEVLYNALNYSIFQYHRQSGGRRWFKSGMNHAQTGNMLENLSQ
jgi:predicted ATP-dependent endonuclease of OLD family